MALDLRQRARALGWTSAVSAVVLVLAAVVAFVTSSKESATWDEPTHISVGIEWLQKGTYDVHPENPPLSRVAVALGPFLEGYRLPAADGTAPGRRVSELIDTDDTHDLGRARLGGIAFFLLAGLVVHMWARRLHGPAVALAATSAFACVPTVLAHAGLATTDLAFAATFCAALLAFTMWLDRPDGRRSILLGACAGIALATKFTSLALIPAAVAILVVRALARESHAASWKVLARRAPMALLVACFVVWGAYRFSFGAPTSHPAPRWYPKAESVAAMVDKCAEPGTVKHAILTPLSRTPLPAPELFNGLVQLCMHNVKGHPAYFLGKTGHEGFAAYYPVAILAKSPIPFLLLALLGVGITLHQGARKEWRALAPLLAAIVLVLVCASGRINIGVRHVMPIYPLLAIPAGHAFFTLLRSADRRLLRGGVAVALAAWLAMAPLVARGDPLAYFNEIASPRADQIVLDSDMDWGQNLLWIEQELRQRGVNDAWMAIEGQVDRCHHALPPVRWLGPNHPVTGWIVIGQIYRKGAFGFHRDEAWPCGPMEKTGHWTDPTRSDYAWLDAYEPVAHVGRGVLLYYVPPAGTTRTNQDSNGL
jgi:hypothetical protein